MKPPKERPSEPRKRKPPFRNFYDNIDEHPVDLYVDGLPEVQTAFRKYRRWSLRLKAQLKSQVQDWSTFVKYSDAQTDLECLRSEAYFNAGYDYGRAGGLAARLGTREERLATKRVKELLLGMGLSRESAARAAMAAALGLLG